ncbi:DUF2953 domain-containing protein [Hathewaya limosa]|uniref:DUF2953 domain-containing protein n=1 Tax=Hathewaya limosa TaxID=1536 RepID=A0ABU0JRQ6_HATLI|nr:DUF2953 domain-containing protein [Hathewaya limosa]MDQ0479758.1 hypothetical protein [Hathewaya limosa]
MRYTIVLGITLIFIVLLFFPIPLKIYVKFIEKNFNFYIYLFNFQLNKKKHDKNKEKSKELNDFSFKKLLKRIFRNGSKEFNYIFKKKLKAKLKANIDYGFGDACETGISYGLFWVGIDTLLNYLTQYFKFKECDINVKPYFNEKKLNLVIESIIYLNLVKIIYILIKFTIIKKKTKEEEK